MSLSSQVQGTMGDRAQRSQPPALAGKSAKRHRRDESQKDYHRFKDKTLLGSGGLDEIMGIYKLRTQETRQTYEVILAIIREAVGDQPPDILCGAADEVLVTLLKSGKTKDKQRKEEVILLLGALSKERYALLVNLVNHYHWLLANVNQRQFLDFDDLIFHQGSHFMSSKNTKLPDGSSRAQRNVSNRSKMSDIPEADKGVYGSDAENGNQNNLIDFLTPDSTTSAAPVPVPLPSPVPLTPVQAPSSMSTAESITPSTAGTVSKMVTANSWSVNSGASSPKSTTIMPPPPPPQASALNKVFMSSETYRSGLTLLIGRVDETNGYCYISHSLPLKRLDKRKDRVEIGIEQLGSAIGVVEELSASARRHHVEEESINGQDQNHHDHGNGILPSPLSVVGCMGATGEGPADRPADAPPDAPADAPPADAPPADAPPADAPPVEPAPYVQEEKRPQSSKWMDATELWKELKKGDLVQFKRKLIYHFGVVHSIENRPDPLPPVITVIHLTRYPSSGINANVATGKHGGRVERGELISVADHCLVRRHNFIDHKYAARENEDLIIQKAETMEGAFDYDLAKSNCEHFATDCRNRIPISYQVEAATYYGKWFGGGSLAILLAAMW